MNANIEPTDLSMWSVKDITAQEVYKTIRRMQLSQGRVMDISVVKHHLLMSNKDFMKAISSLERVGIITIDVERQSLTVVG